MVAMLGILIGSIRRSLWLHCAIVCERLPGDDQVLFGSHPFALQPRLHPACDHLNLHRPFLAVAYLLAADNVSRLSSSRLSRVNQPVISTRNRFLRPHSPPLACF